MPESMEWLSARVPIWALLLAMIGTGTIGMTGGTATWLNNNEPRFAALQKQIDNLQASDEKIYTILSQKVDTQTRLDMLSNLKETMARDAEILAKRTDEVNARVKEAAEQRQRQIDELTRHIEYLDRRVDNLIAPPATRPSPP